MNTRKSNETKKVELAKILRKIDALKFGVFKLTSGKVSPYYIDLRIVPSFPDAFRQICDFYGESIISQVGLTNFDRIAGVPIAGIPFASQIAYNLKKPFLYVRKGVRLHGRQRRVEGILFSGDRVLLVDDLVTTGLTLKKAAAAVTAEGGVVKEAVALLDREEGGKEKLAKNGIRLHALLKISEVANTLYEIGAIDKESLKTILKQIKK
ncbi:MAG TPA: orotate phosphoribosyltransferase [Candidatus Bathyarchaeia archaeon]|nr:orotate phosphoribosyltransferase [Candidatus Bathyarchaeia archaeon]